MNKYLMTLALAGAFAVPAFAQTAAPAAEAAPAAAEPASDHTFTANVGLFSSYRFRGIDQTFGQPAIQGGFDYAHSSGLYLGNWNSNVSSGAGFPEGSLEMDFYGGWKTTFAEDFGFDVGGLYYYYPGSNAAPLSGTNARNLTATANGKVDNFELYVAGSWKFLSLKYSYSFTDYFSLPDSKGSSYLDLTANVPVGDGWSIVGHVGQLFSDYKYAGTTADQSIEYTDWKLGVTKDISGWIIGAAYIGTNAAGNCGNAEFYCFSNSLNANGQLGSKTKDAGRGIGVISVSRTF